MEMTDYRWMMVIFAVGMLATVASSLGFSLGGYTPMQYVGGLGLGAIAAWVITGIFRGF